MKKAEKKLIRAAVLAVFLSLLLLMGVINGIGFHMAAEDADRITQMLSERRGSFEREMGSGLIPNANAEIPAAGSGFGPMGPDSPDMKASIRYFTFSFDTRGENAVNMGFFLNAVSEEEAESWAESLLGSQTGWTRGTYRYRVYEAEGRIFVTVIDQGREMLSCYRILLISLIGVTAGTALAYLMLRLAAKRIFEPVNEADRKQKQFILQAEREFKVPLTIISASTEVLERREGASEQTRTIHRQVRQMTGLVKDLGNLAVYKEAKEPGAVDISAKLEEALSRASVSFEQKGIRLEKEIKSELRLTAGEEEIEKLFAELTANSVSYAKTAASYRLYEEGGHIILSVQNDSQLKPGEEREVSEVFDRFVRLENAENSAGAGLGLWYVKEIVQSLSGRCSVRILADGTFSLRVSW